MLLLLLLLGPSAAWAAPSCQWAPGRDFLAAGAPPQNASTKEECCAICRSTPSCVAGVWCPPTASGESCGLTTGRCYTKFSTAKPRNTSSTVIACVIPPTPGVLAPPKLGDAVFMNNCSEADPHGAMQWAPCAGEACFEPGGECSNGRFGLRVTVAATLTSDRDRRSGSLRRGPGPHQRAQPGRPVPRRSRRLSRLGRTNHAVRYDLRLAVLGQQPHHLRNLAAGV